MQQYKTEAIRNVALLSHSGAGKTSLSEAVLYSAGVVNRLGRVDDGNTVSDYDPEEVKRKASVQLSMLPLLWKENRVNVVDTPGYADFVGEVIAALRAVDGAIIVICAASGVEVGTEFMWKYAHSRSLPRLIFVNKMDRENADFYRTLEAIRGKFGKKCVAAQMPIGSHTSFQGLVDLITLKAYLKDREEKVPDPLKAQAEKLRDALVEAIAETDDDLATKYLEGQEIGVEELKAALRRGTLEGKLVPVFLGSALQNIGVAPFLDSICQYLPSPKDTAPVVATNLATKGKEPISINGDSPLAALVFKTSADPYVGKLSLFRVFSGTMYSDSQVWNATKNTGERIGQLFIVRGKTQEPVPQLIAGDIGAVAKLSETSTGDTLCLKERPLIFETIPFSNPPYSVAVHPKTKADLDRLGSSLARLCDEDPSLRVHKDQDTGETVLSGMGDAHVEVASERLKRKFGVDINLDVPKVPYKETITIKTQAEYKHKKQTGGHGQYGHVFLELEPRPRGSGFEFTERVVGGAVPRNYVPAVEKGVSEGIPEGVLARYPLVDLRVTLYDGSYHPVDSSDMSFKIAGLQALKKGVMQAQPVLLEPIMNVKITVPDNFTGDVIGDLNGKRARVLGMFPEDGLTTIEADAPLAEMLRYATALRSITQGRGIYTMSFARYEEVPAHIAQKIIAEAKKTAEKS
ncbi:MAG: elongation factor G [Chloroflexi bacterium]|nr:elongation factor G [Chloroflexota bacterium]